VQAPGGENIATQPQVQVLICRVGGCGKQLGNTNTSGYCYEHRIMGRSDPKRTKVA